MTTFIERKCSRCGQLVALLGSYFSTTGKGPSKELLAPRDASDLRLHVCPEPKNAKKKVP